MGVKKIASTIGEIAAETLQNTGKAVVDETAQATASVASQVTGQNYVVKQKIQTQRNQKVQTLSQKDTAFKEDALSKARSELQNLKSESSDAESKPPQKPNTSTPPKMPMTSLGIEHHQKAQTLEKPDEETLKRRQELEQKAELERQEEQKKEEEEKQKNTQFIEPQGKQSGPVFGKKPKKPLIVQLEQTKTETRGGVGG